ncbi:MAG: efflux RND transporter periplasmic adaptor subunit [Thermoanaerobaculia bacterium]|nr:MAG: efflux RND transporter periplasmic adaptor subunit [Thermoanaerobaculia bacterium]MBZ0101311.1 efflux RND transporter periplasmic adaptor subunit [Thermoanaerobaculia bacterium]
MNRLHPAWRRSLFAVFACVLVLLPFAGCGGAPADPAAEAEVWYCPMHPDYVSDRPGSCPICHMDLVRRETAPVDARPPATGATHATVDLDAAARALVGVETAAAALEPWSDPLRASGNVVADERRTVRIEARFGGWIEQLQADYTGRYVRRGETMAEVFSPELLAAQQEFLLARDLGRRFVGSALPEVRRSGEDLVAAARRRLETFALPPGFIDGVAESGVPRRTVPVVAPTAGFVTEKGVFAGQQVVPGQEMFRLVDLSSVWVEANFYEADAVRVSTGDAAHLSLAYAPESGRAGLVSYVYPEIDATTRTLRVRFDIPNPELDWKPGMFVDIELAGQPREALVVPDAAVLDTGERRLVFVEVEPDRFEPREVGVGERRGGRAEILSGLATGERVATRANFLLDSESRLRAAFARRAPAAGAGHEEHR